jgi:hypothetical protein
MALGYLCDDCHKQAVTHIRESRRFESMYTLQGKNPNNTQHTLSTLVYTHPTYAFYWQSPYVTTFRWLPRSWNRSLHPKEVLTTKDRLTQPSSWVVSFFLTCDSPGVGERGFDPMVTQLLQLTWLISPACDRYVQYLLTGANPSILNWHRQGLEPWRCRLATYHSLTFPISCLHFPLMVPPGLQFNQVPSTKSKCWM